MQAKLTALSVYVPERVIDNHYFEQIMDTSDEWIVSRTGIKTRRYTASDEFCSDLCVGAAKNLAKESGKSLDDVDFIIVATVTGDQIMPSMACQLQHRLNIKNAGAIDISAACAGFMYAIILAKGLIAAGSHKKVLVVGSEALTKYTDFEDRTSCILFGDGAGAAFIEAAEKGNIFNTVTGSCGELGHELYMSHNETPVNGHKVKANHTIQQNGRSVFKWAVTTIPRQVEIILQKNNMTLDDIDWFVPHSANMRIIESVCADLKFPLEKTLESISEFGNTSTASIPLAIYKGIKEGKVKKGDKLLMIGFGGGLVYAGGIIEW